MLDVPATPSATLTAARRIALGNGLRQVCTGTVHDPEAGTTSCPGHWGARRVPVRLRPAG